MYFPLVTSAVNESAGHTGTKEISQNLILPINCLGLDVSPQASLRPTLIDLFHLFIYLLLAALGLRCCARAFSSCGERGLLLVAVCGLLIAVASLAVEHGL